MTRLVLVEDGKMVQALPPTLDPSSATEDRITMKDIAHVTILIHVANATSVTPSTITLTQSTDVSGADEKELAFDTVYSNTDTSSSDTLVKTDVVSNTFDTDGTDNFNQLHVIEIDGDELDVNNDFDVLKVNIGDASNQTIGATYVGTGIRYAQAITPSAITD